MRKRAKENLSKMIDKLRKFGRKIATRQFSSYLLMVGFILFTSIGAGIFSPALGFIAAGISCGLYGFLLGLE
jgi:hypothetical protein